MLEFDDQVTSGSGSNTCPSPSGCQGLDLYPGWRSLGYDDVRDVTAKLTYYVAPTAKLSVTGIRYERERLPFDFDYLLTGFDPLQAPAVTNREDSLAAAGGRVERIPQVGLAGDFQNRDLVQGSIAVSRSLYTAKWDHTLGRWAYKVAAGLFEQSRETCNFYQSQPHPGL